MLGALAGDTIGSVHEFSENEDSHFPLFSQRCCPTDDNLLTGAVALALLEGSTDFRRCLVEAYKRVATKSEDQARMSHGLKNQAGLKVSQSMVNSLISLADLN
jgi:ADP-ribosylglycohydrolase